MQGKVSMVVPCYNKENYIGAMLDSVLAQDWDNLELLLVNDGSTDGTRDVIAAFLPKFERRGYDVKLIDQENGGCCKAVHTGLVNMTGDYFCLVDADDEIEPAYVSTMAGWLDEYNDYEWASCSYKTISKIDGEFSVLDKPTKPFLQDTDNLLIHYIFRKVITTVWIYMMRTSYVHKCGMIDNFCTDRSKTYEPLIMIPPAAHKGKMKFFNEPLYRYNFYASDLYGFSSLEKAREYYDDYLRMYEWSINRLTVPENDKKQYLMMAHLSYYLELFRQVPQIAKTQNKLLAEEVINVIINTFSNDVNLNVSAITKLGHESLFDSIEAGFLPENKSYKRIIGYGALGKMAQKLLPKLIYTNYFPSELWDVNGDNERVKQPDLDSLTSDDLILVFPINEEVLEVIRDRLNKTSAAVYYKKDIERLISEPKLKYPQLAQIVRDYKC